MRKREILLDFTSLLDVTLIVIFFFVLFSHLENEDNKAAMAAERDRLEQEEQIKIDELQDAIDDANHREELAKEREEQLLDEIEMVRKSSERQAQNVGELLAFKNSKNIQIILEMESSGWQAKIACNEEILGIITKDGDAKKILEEALSKGGYTIDNTILCVFVYDAREAGSYSAIKRVNEAIEQVSQSYRYFYVSKTNKSIGEE